MDTNNNQFVNNIDSCISQQQDIFYLEEKESKVLI